MEKVRFSRDLVKAREFSLTNIREKSIPGEGNGWSRGPRAAPSLGYSGGGRKPVWAEQTETGVWAREPRWAGAGRIPHGGVRSGPETQLFILPPITHLFTISAHACDPTRDPARNRRRGHLGPSEEGTIDRSACKSRKQTGMRTPRSGQRWSPSLTCV